MACGGNLALMTSRPGTLLPVPCCWPAGWLIDFPLRSFFPGQPCIPVEENAGARAAIRPGEVCWWTDLTGKAGRGRVTYSLLEGRSVLVLANGPAISLCVNPGGILLSETKRRLS